jgi:hypothetical protein
MVDRQKLAAMNAIMGLTESGKKSGGGVHRHDGWYESSSFPRKRQIFAGFPAADGLFGLIHRQIPALPPGRAEDSMLAVGHRGRESTERRRGA